MKSEGFKRQGHNNLDSKGTMVVWYHFRRGRKRHKTYTHFQRQVLGWDRPLLGLGVCYFAD